MFPYMYETQFLVEEGATPAQVDRALTGFGMAMGMFAVDDMAGLDVGWRVQQALGHFSDPRERRPLVHDRLVAMGRLGQKRGAGWYRYDDPRTPTPDPEVEALIRSLADAAGIAARPIADEEIVERAIFALVNEGARALEAGVAARASDIDVIYVNGYGFPGWRGGPLFYADRLGLADGARPHPGVPSRARRALAAGAAARRARRARRHVPRRADRDGEETLTCRPPSRDACARRGCCRRTRSSAGTIAAGCASARRTPWGRIRRR